MRCGTNFSEKETRSLVARVAQAWVCWYYENLQTETYVMNGRPICGPNWDGSVDFYNLVVQTHTNIIIGAANGEQAVVPKDVKYTSLWVLTNLIELLDSLKEFEVKVSGVGAEITNVIFSKISENL